METHAAFGNGGGIGSRGKAAATSMKDRSLVAVPIKYPSGRVIFEINIDNFMRVAHTKMEVKTKTKICVLQAKYMESICADQSKGDIGIGPIGRKAGKHIDRFIEELSSQISIPYVEVNVLVLAPPDMQLDRHEPFVHTRHRYG